MKLVLKSVRILFVLLCISKMTAVASPMTLSHLKILFGDGPINLPNPIEIVKSFIPRRGCGINCRNRDYDDQEERRHDIVDHRQHHHPAHHHPEHHHPEHHHPKHHHPEHHHHHHDSHEYEGHHHPHSPPPQEFMHQSHNPNWNVNHRPHQTYGAPYDNWQNSQNSQQVYSSMNGNNNLMVPNNQEPPTNSNNAQFYRPLPGQPQIVENGYNPSVYQQNIQNQPNIMEQTEISKPNNNPLWQNLPNLKQVNSSPPWQNQPQIVESMSSPSAQNQTYDRVPNQSGLIKQTASAEPSSNPWQNQGEMFQFGFNQPYDRPNIVETPSDAKFQNPVIFQPTPPTTNSQQPNLQESIIPQAKPTNLPLINSLNSNHPANLPINQNLATETSSKPPVKAINDFIYPDSERYVHDPNREIDAESPLIDIRRRSIQT